MDVLVLPLQTCLEPMPVLQLFVGISGQYLSPTVFLVESLSMPNQTKQLHPLSPRVLSWCPQGSWCHWFSLLFAGTCPCGFCASFSPSEMGFWGPDPSRVSHLNILKAETFPLEHPNPEGPQVFADPGALTL